MYIKWKCALRVIRWPENLSVVFSFVNKYDYISHVYWNKIRIAYCTTQQCNYLHNHTKVSGSLRVSGGKEFNQSCFINETKKAREDNTGKHEHKHPRLKKSMFGRYLISNKESSIETTIGIKTSNINKIQLCLWKQLPLALNFI